MTKYVTVVMGDNIVKLLVLNNNNHQEGKKIDIFFVNCVSGIPVEDPLVEELHPVSLNTFTDPASLVLLRQICNLNFPR